MIRLELSGLLYTVHISSRHLHIFGPGTAKKEGDGEVKVAPIHVAQQECVALFSSCGNESRIENGEISDLGSDGGSEVVI